MMNRKPKQAPSYNKAWSKAEKAWETRIQAPKRAPSYNKAWSKAEKAWETRIQAPKRAPSAKKAWSKANKEYERDRVIGIKRVPGAKSKQQRKI